MCTVTEKLILIRDHVVWGRLLREEIGRGMTACRSLTTQLRNFDFIPGALGIYGKCQQRTVR